MSQVVGAYYLLLVDVVVDTGDESIVVYKDFPFFFIVNALTAPDLAIPFIIDLFVQ